MLYTIHKVIADFLDRHTLYTVASLISSVYYHTYMYGNSAFNL